MLPGCRSLPRLNFQDDVRLQWSIDTALLLMSLLAVAYLAMNAVLLIRLPANPLTLGAVSLVLVSSLVFVLARWVQPISWLAYVIAAVVAAGAIAANVLVYDTSYDGQVYHALAVLQLQEGWNPFYDPTYATSPYVRHYPKAPWMIGNFFYTFIRYFDVAKTTNILSLGISFFAVLGALTNLFVGRSVALLAFVAAGLASNPVVLAQLFTSYNDGLVGSLLLTFIAMLAMYAVCSERKAIIVAAIALMILVNIKFTAVGYAGVVSIGFFLFIQRTHPAKLAKSFLFLFSVGAISVLGIGFNPYVTNTLSMGHPFFPLAGKGKIDIMTANSPADFIGKNRFEKLARSISGKTGDPWTPQKSRRKKFFSVDIKEFENVNVDTRVAGFGPFSLWIVAGSGLLLLALLIWDWRRGVYGGLFAGTILASVFLHPESWWARYVPQLWIVPFALVLCGLFSGRVVPRAAAGLVLLLATVNAGGAGSATVYRQVDKSTAVHNQLNAMQSGPVTIAGGQFVSVAARLKEKGIAFTRVKPEACAKPIAILYSDMEICTP